MSCRVTPNVDCGAVKIQWTSSVSPSQDDPSAPQVGFAVFEVVNFISEMAEDRSLAILELWHAETGSADLNQL
jgi:hypothetical protein